MINTSCNPRQAPYAYGYDVNGYDEYGNPNVHSKHEERDGKTVKGKCIKTLALGHPCWEFTLSLPYWL